MAGQALVILEPVCTQENPYFNQEDLLDSLAHYHLQLSPNNPAILIRVIVIIQNYHQLSPYPNHPHKQPPYLNLNHIKDPYLVPLYSFLTIPILGGNKSI